MEYCQLLDKSVGSNGVVLRTKQHSVLAASYLQTSNLGEDFLAMTELRHDSVILHLNLLDIPKAVRNHGEGTFLMNMFVEILDCDKRWVINGANPKAVSRSKRLRLFYALYGFEENPLLKDGVLIRKPQLVRRASYDAIAA